MAKVHSLATSAIILTGAEARAGIFGRAVNWIKGNPNYCSMTYQEARRQISIPKQAGDYCNLINYKSDNSLYGKKDFSASLKLTHQNKAGDCDDFAVACAALLSDDGYSPSVLILGKGKKYHSVYVYQDGGYGSVGKGSDNKDPKFDSINKLVHALKYDEFALVSLDGNIVDGEYDLDISSGVKYKSVYSSAFKPDLRSPSSRSVSRTSKIVKTTPKPKPLPVPRTTPKPKPLPLPRTPQKSIPISKPILTRQDRFEIARKEKLNYFNSEKQTIIGLIRSGRIGEADKLTQKLLQEIQEARAKGFY